jgi:hypothetical protein
VAVIWKGSNICIVTKTVMRIKKKGFVSIGKRSSPRTSGRNGKTASLRPDSHKIVFSRRSGSKSSRTAPGLSSFRAFAAGFAAGFAVLPGPWPATRTKSPDLKISVISSARPIELKNTSTIILMCVPNRMSPDIFFRKYSAEKKNCPEIAPFYFACHR